jgi:hypothetical protein
LFAISPLDLFFKKLQSDVSVPICCVPLNKEIGCLKQDKEAFDGLEEILYAVHRRENAPNERPCTREMEGLNANSRGLFV